MCKNKHGFTLVEFLVALVIMMVGLLGLLQTVNVSIEHNLNNQIRNEATILADERMSLELSKPFDAVSTTTSGTSVNRRFMNGFRSFSVSRSGAAALTNSKQVNVIVSWRHKKVRYEHGTSSVISKNK